MTDDFSKLLADLPPDLIEDLDDALRAYGMENLRELIEKGPCPPGTCDSISVPRHRWQDAIIEDAIPPEASVLDLGCGSGDLLGRLISDKNVRGQGIEMDFESVLQCVRKGIPVFQANLDDGLAGFPDQSFDFVILEETVQTLHKPLELLQELLRVGRRGLVSFPNFGCWNVRLELALRGRMPVTEELPYHWYDTPNIHLLTLRDFFSWAETHGVRITGGHVFVASCVRPLEFPGDNLLAEEVLLAIEPA